jgi:hypothetical protein
MLCDLFSGQWGIKGVKGDGRGPFATGSKGFVCVTPQSRSVQSDPRVTEWSVEIVKAMP